MSAPIPLWITKPFSQEQRFNVGATVGERFAVEKLVE
jgi:hypothetical protein